MKNTIFALILTTCSFAFADGEPVGTSTISISPSEILIQTEIQKDLNSPLTLAGPSEDEWVSAKLVNDLLEKIPALKQDF